MNIVFWFLIIVALALVWLCGSFAFKGIGSLALKLFNDAKEEISGDESEKIKKGEDETNEKR